MTRMPSGLLLGKVFWACPGEEAPGWNENMLERLHAYSSLGTPWYSLGQTGGGGWGKGGQGFSPEAAVPATQR